MRLTRWAKRERSVPIEIADLNLVNEVVVQIYGSRNSRLAGDRDIGAGPHVGGYGQEVVEIVASPPMRVKRL